MTRTLARIVDSKGQILLPPAPSHMYIEDGKPIQNYTLAEVEDLALEAISRKRDPQIVEKSYSER